MRLLHSLTSPFARKVRVTLLEKGLACEPVVLLAGDASVSAVNPLGKVPALLRADGTALYDSPVIVQYLEVLVPTPSLFPADPLARIEVLRLEALCDGICDAAVLRMIEGRRDPARQDPNAVAHQAAKITRGLAVLQAELGDRAYAVGDTYTLADTCVAMAIGYIDLRAPELLAPFPALVERYAAMLARPSLAATVPPK